MTQHTDWELVLENLGRLKLHVSHVEKYFVVVFLVGQNDSSWSGALEAHADWSLEQVLFAIRIDLHSLNKNNFSLQLVLQVIHRGESALRKQLLTKH